MKNISFLQIKIQIKFLFFLRLFRPLRFQIFPREFIRQFVPNSFVQFLTRWSSVGVLIIRIVYLLQLLSMRLIEILTKNVTIFRAILFKLLIKVKLRRMNLQRSSFMMRWKNKNISKEKLRESGILKDSRSMIAGREFSQRNSHHISFINKHLFIIWINEVMNCLFQSKTL